MKRTEQMGQEYRAALDGLRFSEQDKGRMVEELMAGREVRRTLHCGRRYGASG